MVWLIILALNQIKFYSEEDKRISDVRNHQVLDDHAGKAIGLDVSE
jgi:lysozyme